MSFHNPRTLPFPSFPLHFSISFHLTLHSLYIFHLASLEHIFRAHLWSTSLKHISILSIHFHLHSSSCTLTISPPRRSCGGTQHPIRRSTAARSCRPRATGAPTSSSRATSWSNAAVPAFSISASPRLKPTEPSKPRTRPSCPKSSIRSPSAYAT